MGPVEGRVLRAVMAKQVAIRSMRCALVTPSDARLQSAHAPSSKLDRLVRVAEEVAGDVPLRSPSLLTLRATVAVAAGPIGLSTGGKGGC